MSTQHNHEAIARDVALSLEANVEILRASARLEIASEPDPRDEHVRSSLEHAAEIIRACVDLGRSNNPTGLGLLARAHLEALIQILWVTASVQNAEELSEASGNEIIRIAGVNMRSGKLRVVNKVTGSDETAALLADERMKVRSRRRSVEACALEVGVQDIYNVFYRFMSLEVHGHKLGVDKPKLVWELTAMHLQGIGGITKALGHVAVRWLLHRQRPNNEELRRLLGLAQ